MNGSGSGTAESPLVEPAHRFPTGEGRIRFLSSPGFLLAAFVFLVFAVEIFDDPIYYPVSGSILHIPRYDLCGLSKLDPEKEEVPDDIYKDLPRKHL